MRDRATTLFAVLAAYSTAITGVWAYDTTANPTGTYKAAVFPVGHGQGFVQKIPGHLSSTHLPYTATAASETSPLVSVIGLANENSAVVPTAIVDTTGSSIPLQAVVPGKNPGDILGATRPGTLLNDAPAAAAGYGGQANQQAVQSSASASASPSSTAANPQYLPVTHKGEPAAVSIPFPSNPATAQAPAAVPSATQPGTKPGTASAWQGLPPAYTTAILRPAEKYAGLDPTSLPSSVPATIPVGYTRPMLPVALASTLRANAAALVPLQNQETVATSGSGIASKQTRGNALRGNVAKSGAQGLPAASLLPQAVDIQSGAVTGAGVPVEPVEATLRVGDVPGDQVPLSAVPTIVPGVAEPLTPALGSTSPSAASFDITTSVPTDTLDTLPDPAIQGKYDLPYSMTGARGSTSSGPGGADTSANTRGAFVPSSTPGLGLPPTDAEFGPTGAQALPSPITDRNDPASSLGGKYSLPGLPAASLGSARGGGVAALPPSGYPTGVGDGMVPGVIGIGNPSNLPSPAPYMEASASVVPLSGGADLPLDVALQG
eukprot:jgi/Botrbrau1/9529/Bobra.0211s0020.1